MAWWDRLRFAGGRKNDTLDLFREIYGSAASSAGGEVTMQSAMQCGVAFACAQRSVTPSVDATDSSRASMSANVAEPYTSGSRTPSRCRFGPFNTPMSTYCRAPSARRKTAQGHP